MRRAACAITTKHDKTTTDNPLTNSLTLRKKIMKAIPVTKATRTLAILGAVSTLISCAATQTALEHHSLEANTKLSKTIFLDPVSASQKTIFIAVKNTSQETVNIAKPLAASLKAEGYRVMDNPSKAHYMLQANIRKVGKMSIAASKNALAGGYGSALAGAATGAALGSFGNSNTTMGGAIAGGLIGLAADSLIKDVNYTVITDVQISERVGNGVKVQEYFNSALENGSASSTYQTSNAQTNYKRYRTRMVSHANKVNLSFKEASPALEQGIVRTLAGLF
jgi:outer membrane lipoprotein SlyB